MPTGEAAPHFRQTPLMAVSRQGVITLVYHSAENRLHVVEGSPETGWTQQALDGSDDPWELTLHQEPDGTLYLVWYSRADRALRFATRWNRWESRTVWQGTVGALQLHLHYGLPQIYFVDSDRGNLLVAVPAPFEVVGQAWLPIIGR